MLLFEVEEDAGRYIDMLEAQDFPSARAVEIETADLLAFCDEGGHALGLVPADAVVVPPEATVDTFDWKVGESTEAAEELEGATRDEAVAVHLHPVDQWVSRRNTEVTELTRDHHLSAHTCSDHVHNELSTWSSGEHLDSSRIQ